MEIRKASTLRVTVTDIEHTESRQTGAASGVDTLSVGLSLYLLELQLLKQALASTANSLGFWSLVSDPTFGVELVYGY